jgi:hypothetical protein
MCVIQSYNARVAGIVFGIYTDEWKDFPFISIYPRVLERSSYGFGCQ